MATTDAVETRQDSGRLIAFSDGVVAIAITLLILPLADITLPSDNSTEAENPLGYVWQENQSLITSFLISWFVILAFWLAHHRMFGDIERVNGNIIKYNVLWLFGIIILPFPMNLLDQVGPNSPSKTAASQTTTFYIATMLFISLMLALISREVRRNPDLLSESARQKVQTRTVRSWIITWYLLLLLPVAWFAPAYATWALLGLLAVQPIADKIDSIILGDEEPGPSPAKPSKHS
ncbi:MAG: TMEM175 family protein [Candidatus Nanopelagicales bacterium]